MDQLRGAASALDSLASGVAELASSDAWRRHLDVQSRFHRYSFANTVLIATQRPDATLVAGYRAWERLGRHVRRGERAIRILAPVLRRSAADDETVVAFRAASVFDVAQTDGRPLPEVCRRLDGLGPLGAFDRLVDVARTLGFAVEDHHFGSGVNGDCNHCTARIRVEIRNSGVQRVKTLAHELGHALLHAAATNRAEAELEAESVAYVVCRSLGVDAGAYSFGYVACWAGGGEEALRGIRNSGGRIQSAAARILEELESGQSPATTALSSAASSAGFETITS